MNQADSRWPATLQGVILAAGYGQRLRPLTDLKPKPLIPVLGTTPIDHSASLLRALGIDTFAVNCHHLSDQIKAWAAEQSENWHVSHELEILGTGGAFAPLKPWQGDSHIVAVNGDVVADFDLAQLVETHFEQDAWATMVLLPTNIPGENAVFFHDDQILDIGKEGPAKAERGNYACAQVLSPRFTASLPNEGFYDIIFDAGYKANLAVGNTIAASVHTGSAWHDIRDPGAYAEGVFDLLRRPPANFKPGTGRMIGVGENANIGEAKIQGPAFLGEGCELVGPCELGPDIVIEAGAKISHSQLRKSIVWSDADVASTKAEKRIFFGPDQVAL